MAKLPGKKIDAELTWDAVAKKYLEMFEEVILLRASRLQRDESAYLCAGAALDTGRSTLDTLWGTL